MTGVRELLRLGNPIREYAWGSRTVLARLLGRPVPSPTPEAELWVGAHPASPSWVAGSGQPLTELIEADPDGVLSERVVNRFGPRLPYLLKVLAAAAPLSLQAHPDPTQAVQGYEAEEAAGVARDARHRRYVDPYHKPELLVAVSEFRALCGFRDPAVTAERLAALTVSELASVQAALAAGELATAVRLVLTNPEPERLVAAVTAQAVGRPEFGLVTELAAAYPGDPGVVLALLLNEVTLAPGEAIFMPAGNLHAYLRGTGIELMAASDNVLRGGLTNKHVDVPELLRVLRFEPLIDPVQQPVPVADGVVTWSVPVDDFALYRVRLDESVQQVELDLSGPRTVLCMAGEVQVTAGAEPVALRQGEAGWAPAGQELLVLSGAGEAFVASVGSNGHRRA